MDDNTTPAGPDVDAVSSLLMGDDEDFDYGDTEDDAGYADPNGSFGEEEPVHETVEPGVLGSERRKPDDVEEIEEVLQDEGLAPSGQGSGEQPETQAGIEPAASQQAAPAALKPINEIGSKQEADKMFAGASAQKQELNNAVEQLNGLLANNQISQQQHRSGMLNAQSMSNNLDSYVMQLQRRSEQVGRQTQQRMATEQKVLLDLHPEFKDPEVFEGKMTQVRNFLKDSFSEKEAKEIEQNVTASQLSFLVKMQKLASGNSRNEKLLKQAARKMKAQNKQQKTELKAARTTPRQGNGNLGMSNTASKVAAIDKLLYGS